MALATTVGHQIAEESLKDMHWYYTGRHNAIGAPLSDRDWPKESLYYKNLLRSQNEKIIRTKCHIDQLFQKAMSSDLGERLRQPGNIMSEAEYNATPQDSDMMKGAKWIIRASNSNKLSAQDIVSILNSVHNSNRSVFQLDTLKFLHDNLVPPDSINPRRPLNSEQPWPSSAAGKLLQTLISEKVRTIGARTNLFTDSDWDSMACFFMGAYTRAHGFPDGNGRPNRALYVLTLLEGGRPFVAPEARFTKASLVHSLA